MNFRKNIIFLLFVSFLSTPIFSLNVSSEDPIVIAKISRKKMRKKNKKKVKVFRKKPSKQPKKSRKKIRKKNKKKVKVFRKKPSKQPKKSRKKIRKKKPSYKYTAGMGNGSFLSGGYHVHGGYNFNRQFVFDFEYEYASLPSHSETLGANLLVSSFHLGVKHFVTKTIYLKYIYQRDVNDAIYTSAVANIPFSIYHYQPISSLGVAVGNKWQYKAYSLAVDWVGYLYPVFREEAEVLVVGGAGLDTSNAQNDLSASLAGRLVFLKMTLGFSI